MKIIPALLMLLSGSPLGPGNSSQDSTDLDARLTYGKLIAAGSTMVTAWDLPRNPVTDSSLAASSRAVLIQRGFRLFMQTPVEAARFVGNRLACGNCHLNGGQRERALPMVGVAHAFPEYNKREGRIFSLEDRIVGCFMRSENASGVRPHIAGRDHGTADAVAYPDTASDEVVALAAYIRWLAENVEKGDKLPWRGKNVIPPDSCLSIDKLDPARGKTLYLAQCTTCHGKNGQGVQIGDKRAGPLWGPNSWNDGAGAARIYTLAGFIRYAMPYLKPGSLSNEESQHIAAYINSMRRPRYPFKDKDYTVSGVPRDAVYYRRPSSRCR